MADDSDVASIVTRIGVIAPQITGLSTETLTMLAGDALDQATVDGFTGSLLSLAAGYLAAHYAYLAFNQNSAIKSETAAVLSHEFFDRSGSDDYLAEYQRLLASLDGSDYGPTIARLM